jgi:hypothetical protein
VGIITHTQYRVAIDMDKHLTDNRVFDLIGLIVEGHHQGSKPIIVEQHELLLDRAPGTQLKGTAKVIVLESNVEELESTNYLFLVSRI